MEGEKKGCCQQLWKCINPRSFVAVVVWVVGIWFACVVVALVWKGLGIDWTDLGDAFGTLNVLYTGLAFAAVYHQFLLQKDEIDHLKRTDVESRKAESIRAQPCLSFELSTHDAATDCYTIAYFNYRAMATEVTFDSNLCGVTMDCDNGRMLLTQQYSKTPSDTVGKLCLKFGGNEVKSFKITMRYRDALGEEQLRTLRYDSETRKLGLADGSSWDRMLS